ncbi:hypothetical protein IBTHAUMO2_1050030 [Nitrosopumilaceae archaeon]|nr:hypothetical protein IBTHAUMO2_1050030 [Nitrosopumilaceae archaeon]
MYHDYYEPSTLHSTKPQEIRVQLWLHLYPEPRVGVAKVLVPLDV